MNLRYIWTSVLILIGICSQGRGGLTFKSGPPVPPAKPECSLTSELIQEIRSYQPTVTGIIEAAVEGDFKGHVYTELAEFTDTFGPRWTGTASLESSIDYMLAKMTQNGFENVVAEEVTAPYKWIRGSESAELVYPVQRKLRILAQDPSVSTGPGGLEADVLVVTDLKELEERRSEAYGKILVFDYAYTSYDDALPYWFEATPLAAKFGAVGTLIRSITPFSMDSLHACSVVYSPEYPKIPAGVLTVEDSAMLRRFQERGQTPRLKIALESQYEESATTRNSMGEIRGASLPEEIVILAGHIDTVDVSSGAIDDGSGIFIATESIVLLKHLGLVPRRTIRSVLFTAEELGLVGAAQYVKEHRAELNKTIVAFEIDQGAGRPLGLDFAGAEEAACIVQEVLLLLEPLNSTWLGWYNQAYGVSSDIKRLQQEGVPGIGLNNVGQWDSYFWFHHSSGDSMSAVTSEELDMNLALWAAVSYVLADMSVTLPRYEPTDEHKINVQGPSGSFG